MQLKEFFYGKNSDCEIFYSQDILNPKFRLPGLKKESDFTPDTNGDTHLDVYLKAVAHEILNSKPRKVRSNLYKEEREAIKELRKK